MTRKFPLGRKATLGLALATVAVLGACSSDDSSDGGPELSGSILIDGSSTVAPLLTLAAEDFQTENSGVRVTVGTSGTGGGFEKFCAGETDISNASRPIKDEEATEEEKLSEEEQSKRAAEASKLRKELDEKGILKIKDDELEKDKAVTPVPSVTDL